MIVTIPGCGNLIPIYDDVSNIMEREETKKKRNMKSGKRKVFAKELILNL